MNKSVIVGIISFLTIILFLYTGINKLIDYPVFREQIGLSPVLQPFAGLIAFSLPISEFATAILLFIPSWRLYGFYLAMSLMVIFTVYVVAILIFNKHLPCSCGGIIELLSWKQHLVLNCVLILFEFTGIRLQKTIQSEQRLSMQFLKI